MVLGLGLVRVGVKNGWAQGRLLQLLQLRLQLVQLLLLLRHHRRLLLLRHVLLVLLHLRHTAATG